MQQVTAEGAEFAERRRREFQNANTKLQREKLVVSDQPSAVSQCRLDEMKCNPPPSELSRVLLEKDSVQLQVLFR
jgi:hypothetical protein